MTPAQKEAHDILVQAASDAGLVVKIGWLACLKVMEPPPEQTNDLRLAFYAGAQHVFASVMTFLGPDEEPTEEDLLRMGKLYEELHSIEPELMQRGIVTKRH